MDRAEIVGWLRYIAAHTAAIGGLAAGLAFLLSGHYQESIAALLTAAAGFGLPLKPGAP